MDAEITDCITLVIQRLGKERDVIDPQLDGKVVLVTGANHGIGAVIAKAFAAQSCRVFITYYRGACPYSEEELQRARESSIGGDALYRARQQQTAGAVVRHIRAQGGAVAAHEADLADADNVPRLFDLCEANLGPVDILVNNHTFCVLETFDPALTTGRGSRIHLATAATIDAHFAVNAR